MSMKRILVAVDGSAISKLVVERAVELAWLTSARIRLLRVVVLPPSPPPPAILAPDETQRLLATAKGWLNGLFRSVPEQLRDRAMIDLGSPAEAICSAARTFNADLVVIGAHKYGFFSRMLGTNAARIVNRCDRQVFVVRPMPRVIGSADKLHAGEVLREDHERLEAIYSDLLDAYRSGEWAEVHASWEVFDASLRAHLETEERLVFPAFREVDAVEAEALLAEHEELRTCLSAFGVQVELHALPIGTASALIDRLRDHAAREDQVLYPWLDAELTDDMAGKLSPELLHATIVESAKVRAASHHAAVAE